MFNSINSNKVYSFDMMLWSQDAFYGAVLGL